MGKISFETGVREYDLNDTVKVCFNPTDLIFARKVFDTVESLDNLQQQCADRVATLDSQKDALQIYEISDQLEKDIREQLNNLFELDVCTPLFGSMCVYAVGDGLPVWLNFLFAIIDELQGSFDAEKKKMNQRIQKYTAKYSGKLK